MVEYNDNNTNNENGPDAAPKRRTRLFGGRRARSSGHAQSPAASQASAADDPESLKLSPSQPDAQVVASPIGDEQADGAVPTVTISVGATPSVGEPGDAADATAVLNADAGAGVLAPEPGVPATGIPDVETANTTPNAAADADADASSVGATGGESTSDEPVSETATGEAATEPDVSEPYVPRATSTTSLIFHAPVLPELSPASSYEDVDNPDDGEDAESHLTRRRSRRGRNRGEYQHDGGSERGRREPELITEPQKVKGSTRLEAKKQRRRDGRDAGRRRQVVTEDEFLARRESVDRKMVVRSSASRIEIGVLEDDVLAEHYVTKSHNVSLIGNVYLGKVQNVLPSMEAAFVDIGRGRNAVLYAGEVDWSSVESGTGRRIEAALKPGDKLLVQVTKDPVGHKGARLTSQVSLPGRYLVYVPNGSMNGISRKLPDTERARLKKILKAVLPEHAGVIVRTAAEGATEEQLTNDVQRLTSQWEQIQKKVENGHAPSQLHSEPDLLVKIVRDVFNEDFSKLIIDGEGARGTIDEYLAAVAPDLKDRVEIYQGPDSFEEYRINEQVEKALDRKVWLPSGGSLVIDRTEAMTVVDVNTGKFVGSGGNLEETVTKNNLEAAEEIVRQLRLRDIGGIIVVDFIDMVLESNRDLVLRRLVECLSRDRTKHQVAEVTSLGLIQMTRKKIGVGLQESINELEGKSQQEPQEPVGKNGRRKNRGNGASNGAGAGNGGSKAPSVEKPQPHQITDDVKHALSRIAASTIVHDEGDSAPVETSDTERVSPEDVIVLPEGPADAKNDSAGTAREEAPQRSRSGRRGRRVHAEASVSKSDEPDAVSEQLEAGASADKPAPSAPEGRGSRRVSTTAPVAREETTVAILDIPLAAANRPRRRPRDEDASTLLDSVLQALPEPKQPGQGRNRSRRVSSGSISAPAGTKPDTDAGTGAGPLIVGN